MNRKTYCEMMNALENMAQDCEIIIEFISIQTYNRLFNVRREDIKSMDYSILINTGNELITIPYTNIEYISA
jgi:hypothetical protein